MALTQKEYGRGVTNVSIEPTSPADATGAERKLYTFPSTCQKVTVQNHPDSGVTMKVLFNDDGATIAAAKYYDVILSAGDHVSSPDGLMIKTVGVYFSGAATWGTSFTIRGWV